jgi:cellobiose phosphorylase
MQIATAVAMFDYPTARANTLRALSSQQECGAVIHGFRPLNRLIYADKPAWMLMTIPWLIKESGDFELLRQQVPWFESQKSATVWEHLQRAYRYLANDTGKHGLCNQHFADWNDQLEPTEKTGERESVMVSQQLCMGLLEVEQLALHIGDESVGQECKELHAKMAATINDVAWDGGWYQRTICEDGHRLGSRANAEAQIFLNTQSWAILGGIADEQRAQSCMQSVDRLIEQPFGFVICHPPLSSYDDRIGKYCHVRPGVSENGGAYCHAAGFKLVADCMLGRAEEAWRTFVKVAPDNPVNPISNSGIEPFSFTNCYSTVEPVMGKAGYPWRTGTAGWFTMGIVEWILGVRRHYDGLLIDPCLSATIPTALVRRSYRGATYNISIDNRAGLCRGARQIELDGEPIDGKLLPVGKKGREYRVNVLI